MFIIQDKKSKVAIIFHIFEFLTCCKRFFSKLMFIFVKHNDNLRTFCRRMAARVAAWIENTDIDNK